MNYNIEPADEAGSVFVCFIETIFYEAFNKTSGKIKKNYYY
jgi:hypothetical protein